MKTQKTAFITGVTGQDGSYLAKFLLDKGYRVIGMKRRTSLITTDRLDDMEIFSHPNFKLEYGNMTDSSSIYSLLTKYKPDEIYNLAAQSHVRVSFEVPEETLDVVGGGTLKLLEAYRLICPQARFYQASSSEMYGDNVNVPQNEETRMTPASPYAAAKLYAHNLCRNYREGYGLHISSGILFNHETITGDMPLIFRMGTKEEIDIKPISEIVRYHSRKDLKQAINENEKFYQQTHVDTDLQVWDKKGWTKVTWASGYPHLPDIENKNTTLINVAHGCVSATGNHPHIMMDGDSKDFDKIEKGDLVSVVNVIPKSISSEGNDIQIINAKLLGFIVAEGNISKPTAIRLTGKEKDILEKYEKIWMTISSESKTSWYLCKSGFTGVKNIWQLNLNGARSWIKTHAHDLYTENGSKRIPKWILNSNTEVQEAFLDGYNEGDGLKKNSCTYTYKSFTTNSPTLGLGLIYLLKSVTGQDFNVTAEKRNGRNKIYYHINCLSDGKTSLSKSYEKYLEVKKQLESGNSIRKITRDEIASRKFIQKVSRGYMPRGIHHNKIKSNEVKKIISLNEYDGWFYDLETESSTFHCGVGLSHVHNSPVRGETFVTRKITLAAANIKLGKQETLYLGNLDAKRDWGFAGDYVEAMWLMLQQPKGDDYVIATGETHTVSEFLQVVFDYAGLDVNKHVKIDSRLYRPHEVPLLLGDYSKAKKILGWEPKTTFKELAILMYEADLEKLISL